MLFAYILICLVIAWGTCYSLAKAGKPSYVVAILIIAVVAILYGSGGLLPGSKLSFELIMMGKRTRAIAFGGSLIAGAIIYLALFRDRH
jgi:hypothetical protein